MFYTRLYDSLVVSNFIYCCRVWIPFTAKHVEMIESAQRYFMRRLHRRCALSPESIILRPLMDLLSDQDPRVLKRILLLQAADHYFYITRNCLRSKITVRSKSIPKTGPVSHAFSLRICSKVSNGLMTGDAFPASVPWGESYLVHISSNSPFPLPIQSFLNKATLNWIEMLWFYSAWWRRRRIVNGYWNVSPRIIPSGGSASVSPTPKIAVDWRAKDDFSILIQWAARYSRKCDGPNKASKKPNKRPTHEAAPRITYGSYYFGNVRRIFVIISEPPYVSSFFRDSL